MLLHNVSKAKQYSRWGLHGILSSDTLGSPTYVNSPRGELAKQVSKFVLFNDASRAH